MTLQSSKDQKRLISYKLLLRRVTQHTRGLRRTRWMVGPLTLGIFGRRPCRTGFRYSSACKLLAESCAVWAPLADESIGIGNDESSGCILSAVTAGVTIHRGALAANLGEPLPTDPSCISKESAATPEHSQSARPTLLTNERKCFTARQAPLGSRAWLPWARLLHLLLRFDH